MKRLVIKIGGSTLGQHDTSLEDLVWLQTQGLQAVVVHGGGKTITEWLERMKVPTRFANGLRITDEESIGVVVAVLAGLVNKQLVAAINALGGHAVGISGADGPTVLAKIKDAALGLVGEPSRVDAGILESLLRQERLPVVSPIGVLEDGGKATSTLLNINADTVAGAIAGAVKAQEVLFLTDVPGVRDEDGQLLPLLTKSRTRELIAKGTISGGMIPKVEACLQALEHVASTQVLDGRQAHVIKDHVLGHCIGTRISIA